LKLRDLLFPVVFLENVEIFSLQAANGSAMRIRDHHIDSDQSRLRFDRLFRGGPLLPGRRCPLRRPGRGLRPNNARASKPQN
jgi:hypothetical protein